MHEGKLFDQFAYFALKYEKFDILEIYNKFIRYVSCEDRDFVCDHFSLFIRTGLAARGAPPKIKQLIASQYKGEH